MVRDAVIDVLGCIVSGGSEAVSIGARDAYLTPESNPAEGGVLFGRNERTAYPLAALLNAVAGHSQDFDDWEVPGNTHPTVLLGPALLAASAEAAAIGDPVNGGRFVDSFAVGFETLVRLGEGVNFDHYDRGWHTTATLGPIGVAAAVARLWRLNAQQTAHAIAISVSRSIGYTSQFGSSSKPLQAGFAVEAGYMAARLARAGLTGQTTAFEGTRGFLGLMAHGDWERFSAPFNKLGRPSALCEHGILLKPYPNCSYTHRIADCAVSLHSVLRGEVEKIERIEIHLPDFHARILPYLQPKDDVQARFSLPFAVSACLARGGLTLADFDNLLWCDPEIAKLIACCAVKPFTPLDKTLNYDPRQPDRLTVHLHDGRILREKREYPLGAPQNPMSDDAIWEKFLDNTGVGEGREDIKQALAAWTDADDVSGHIETWMAKAC